VRYSSRHDAYANHPYPGGPLEIELAIESVSAVTVDSMAIKLSSPSGTKLVNADIISLGETLRLHPGRNVARFDLEALHLAPGIYALGLWLGPSLGRALDHVESAVSLEVVDASGPGFGTTPAANGLVPCEFRFSQREVTR
jgi:hypothetical protein